MALVREILRSDLKDLTIVSYGGPDVGMLCAAGKARKLIYGFVSLDTIPIEPYFRKAREAGAVEVNEYDEGMLLLGLQAAGWRIPFLPTRVGLGSGVMTYNKHLKTIRSPYADGETLVAMPALPLDVALIHVSRADALGNTQTDGPDPYIDTLFARAAARTYVTAEEVVERIDFAHSAEAKSNLFERSLVTGVVHAPHGAHPTASHDRYGWDIDHLKRYVRSAGEEGGWESYVSGVIGSDEDAYLANVGGASHVDRLPLPVL
jgi:glutaconate CoA-transferase subunit A